MRKTPLLFHAVSRRTRGFPPKFLDRSLLQLPRKFEQRNAYLSYRHSKASLRAFSSGGIDGHEGEKNENDKRSDHLSTNEELDVVPDSFFDEEVEKRKQMLDFATAAMAAGDAGIANLSSPTKSPSLSEIYNAHEFKDEDFAINVEDEGLYDEIEKKMVTSGDSEQNNSDLSYDDLIGLLKDKGNIEAIQQLENITKENLSSVLDGIDDIGENKNTDISKVLRERIPFQEYPRHDKDYERFLDVDNNPDAFPTFSKEERERLQHEISTNQIDPGDNYFVSPSDQKFNPNDVDESAEDFVLPPQYANYSLPARSSDEYPEPLLEKFMPDTAGEKYRFDSQGLRSCPGKRQRKGKDGDLYCHRIDLSTLHYLDTVNLARFIAGDSSIMGRKATGLCSKCQRAVAKTIKRARNFGILPRIGEYVLQDSAPRRKAPYHVKLTH